MLSPISAQPLQSHHSSPKVGAPQQSPAVRASVVETYSRTEQVEVRGQSAGPSLGGTEGVQAYKAVAAADSSTNPFAKTILTFIDAQIRRDIADGASGEELKSRLEAGLQGFEEGYGDAFAQLSGMGLLDDQLRAEIESTRTQVLSGIQALADELGVEIELPKFERPVESASNPVPTAGMSTTPAPVFEPGKAILSAVMRDIQIIEQYQKTVQAEAKYQKTVQAEATYQHLGRSRKAAAPAQSHAYGFQEGRDFSLKLRTTDGDAVTIRMNAERSGVAQFAYGNDRNANTALSVQGSQSSHLQFSVEGELDEEELRALTDLLQQVGGIAEQFFDGDLSRAFELATELSVDRNEIASFDLALTMNRTEVAQTIAGGDHHAESGKTPVDRHSFNGFVDSLMRAGDSAERLGQPRSLVADLLDWVANNNPTHQSQAALLVPVARTLL